MDSLGKIIIIVLLLPSMALAAVSYDADRKLYVDEQGRAATGTFTKMMDGSFNHEYECFSDKAETTIYSGRAQKVLLYLKDTLILERTYSNMSQDWVNRRFHQNGRVSSVVSFRNGLPNGTSNYYTQDGRIKQSVNYSNGKLYGTARFYRTNGTLQFELIARDGKYIYGICVASTGTRRQLNSEELVTFGRIPPTCN